MSEYYDYATPLTAGGLARASDVNARFTELEPAFEKLPSPTKIQQGRVTYCLDTGAANALIASLDFPPAEYTAGIELTVKVAATNTGVSTLNLNGLGVKTIKRANGSALAAGDLTAGYIVKLVYDGTDFRLLGASETAASSSATAAAASATAAAASATAAATSATNAANSATAAAASATAAAASETAAAQSATDAATAVTGYVAKAGSTMTGALTLSGAPTADLHASTKKYVDDAVFASGSAYTADNATITLTGSEFGLTTIANNTVLGNVSGGVAKPGALTATQLTTLVNAFSSTLKGAAPASGGGTVNYLRADGTWAEPPGTTQTSVTGNAGTATALQTARTIAISGTIATGTATSFDGTANISIPITSLNVGNATAGTLAVARGGTGVTSSTGTGSVVLSSAPTLTNPVVGTQASSDNSTKAASTAYVTSAIAALSYASKFLTVVTSSANVTLSDASHNNAIINCTGATSRTITMGTPSTGFACTVKVTGSANRSLSCAGGVYKGSATSTATTGTIASGGSVTLIHIGSGVWIADGQGLT